MSGVSDEAVTAAAEAMWLADGYVYEPGSPGVAAAYRRDARAALVAAMPLIEANLRAELRAEILGERVPWSLQESAGRYWQLGQYHAAAIVGGEDSDG